MKNYVEYFVAYLCSMAFIVTLGVLSYVINADALWVAAVAAALADTIMICIVMGYYDKEKEYYED